MLLTTTPTVQGYKVEKYLGIVTGEAILGANIFKDILANLRDIFGGRSGAYEEELAKARTIAFEDLERQAIDLGANAILGVDIDYETVGPQGGMLMVSVAGTAVKIVAE